MKLTPGLYLNERNGDLIELKISPYNNNILLGLYMCPISDVECETEFECCDNEAKLIYIGEV